MLWASINSRPWAYTSLTTLWRIMYNASSCCVLFYYARYCIINLNKLFGLFFFNGTAIVIKRWKLSSRMPAGAPTNPGPFQLFLSQEWTFLPRLFRLYSGFFLIFIIIWTDMNRFVAREQEEKSVLRQWQDFAKKKEKKCVHLNFKRHTQKKKPRLELP